jgi:UDP-N-acetylglucosamine 1-carboxyvinyltransferase
VLPDRIETGTFLVAGAITGGKVLAKRARPSTLTAVLEKLEDAARTSTPARTSSSSTCAAGGPRSVDVTTAPYPASRPTCRRSSPR